MARKVAIGISVVLMLVLAGGYFWVRSSLGSDAVRQAIAAQMSNAIGQPITIGRISASAYPRVTVKLGDVRLGHSEQIQIGDIEVGTALRALFSRRIEHASLRLVGAKIALPLPPFTGLANDGDTAASSGSPVEIVSIDEIVLSDVQITSGGRTLRGEIELVPQGTTAVEIRTLSLTADDTSITATGHIRDFDGPTGEIALKATNLDFDRLLAFANAFSSGSGAAPAPAAGKKTSSPPAPASRSITLSLEADKASMGSLVLEKLSGKARLTNDAVILDPIHFGVFGGSYDGGLTMSLDATPRVTANAKLAGVDVAAATAFAGVPNQISGRLSGALEFAGTGSDAAALTNSARGTLRVDVKDGVVKNLGLVNAIVVATSMRSDSVQATSSGSKDEPFSLLGATFALVNGAVLTNDLTFVSKNLNLSAQGVLQLAQSTVDLGGKVQLSDELSKQAGRDLVRYTQDQGRVTLPVTISGPMSAPSVRVDMGDMAKRAVTNAAKEEASKRLKSGLSGLLKK